MSDGNTCPNCLQKDQLEMSRLENFIMENSNTNLNLEDIASSTGISDKNLNRFLAQEQFSNFVNKIFFILIFKCKRFPTTIILCYNLYE